MKAVENRGRPNCIFIAADHLRYDVLGQGFTPNIDKLMGDSVSFSSAYCASPLCVPSRGALFTGTYPGNNGSLINGWYKPESKYSKVKEEIDNLYHFMERMDMECVHSGKQHLFVEGEPLQRRAASKTTWMTEHSYQQFLKDHGKRQPGGPRFRTSVPEVRDGAYTKVSSYSNASTGVYEDGEEYYFDRFFTKEALRYLDHYDGEKPLFLSLMYLAPHPPLEIPQPWYSRIKEEELNIPDNVGEWYPNQSPLQKYNVTGVIGNQYHKAQWREIWRVYLGLVSLLDDCVGEITDKLKQKGIYENSLIVFTSDHGEMLGSHGLFQKMCMYEESARIPLSIHMPGGGTGGRIVEDAVSHIDVFPTLCNFYGEEPLHMVDGVSLKNCLLDQEERAERPVYIQYDGNSSRCNSQRCVIWKKHKLIVDMFKDEIYYELYDLEHDPLERSNLLFQGVGKDLAKELYQMLRIHMKEIKDSIELGAPDLEPFLEHYKIN